MEELKWTSKRIAEMERSDEVEEVGEPDYAEETASRHLALGLEEENAGDDDSCKKDEGCDQSLAPTRASSSRWQRHCPQRPPADDCRVVRLFAHYGADVGEGGRA